MTKADELMGLIEQYGDARMNLSNNLWHDSRNASAHVVSLYNQIKARIEELSNNNAAGSSCEWD